MFRTEFAFVLLIVSLLTAGPAASADLHLFGRVGNSDHLGLENPAFGVQSRLHLGEFIVSAVMVDAEKSPGAGGAMFYGASLEWRREAGEVGSFLYGGRANFLRQDTERYKKDGFYPTVVAGWQTRKKHVAVLFQGNLPDSTENETWGLGLTVEALSTPVGVIVEVERVFFRPGGEESYDQGTRVGLALGWRF